MELDVEQDLRLDLAVYGSCYWRVVDGTKVRIHPREIVMDSKGRIITPMEWVSGIYLVPIGYELRILIDYGRGPGVLFDDGRILWVGEGHLTERCTPKRMGRYTMEVNPWSPSHIHVSASTVTTGE